MSYSNSKLAPGPKGHWLLGSLPDFVKGIPPFLFRMREEHGPVVRFRLLRGINYLISDPALIDEVLNKQHEKFIKNRGFWQHFTEVFGQGLLSSEGDHWRTHRKLAAPAFQPKRLAHYVDIMVQHSQRLLAHWQPGEVRDIHDDMMTLTAEIIAKALFNVELADRNHALRDAVHELEKQIALRMVRPFMFLDDLPLPSNIRYWWTLRTIERQIARFIADHRRAPEQQRTLLSMLMAARYDDGSALSNKQLRDETLTLFLAGHDTTAITLSWAFYLLSQHPQYWQRLRNEWQSVLQDQAPDWESLAQLPLTKGVIKESLRLYPAAYLFGREPLETVNLGGYQIPKGVGVVISPYVMGRHPDYFTQPNMFDPDRWTSAFEKQLPRYAFIPFGGGPRTCIGEGFAMMEAMVLLIEIGRRFTLVYADTTPPVPLSSITMPPQQGMRMQVEKV